MSLRVRLSLPFPLLTENACRPGETDPESSIPRLRIRRNKAFFPAFAIRDICAVLDPHDTVNAKKKGSAPNALELRGEDIGGIGVHIGARVSALAGPNDVLVSSTLRDLVIGSGLEFEERGAHELKGVPGEWRLYAVTSA
jgi:hypothetical protein